MKNDTVLLFITIPLFLILLLYYNCVTAYAQWMLPSIPSPYMKDTRCCKYVLNKSDTFPPKIMLDTNKLHEGTNVLYLEIIDDSPLVRQEVNYSVGNDSKTAILAKAFDNKYRALLKVLPPISNLQVEAMDVNGNSAQLKMNLGVEENNPFSLMDLLNITTWKDKIFGERLN